MSDDNQKNTGSKSYSTTEVNLFDENHSALAINSMCSYYKSDILLEFRPLDTSSNTVKYINDKSNIKFSISIDETPKLKRQLEAFISGELPEFIIEHHGARMKRNLVFTQGNVFYNDVDEHGEEMVAKCADSRSIYVEDVTSDDEDDHFLTVFIDYGEDLDLGNDNTVRVFSFIEIFKSAIDQLYNEFMRFDFTSTRLTLANSAKTGGAGTPRRPASQPRPSRPGRRGLTKAATTHEVDTDIDNDAVDTELDSMFDE